MAANPSADEAWHVADIAALGELIVLVTLGNAMENAIDLAGKEHFMDKVVIDMTTPLNFSNGLPPVFTGSVGHSLGEQIQKQLPASKVVKAFNAAGVHIVLNPQREEGNPVMFIACNDEGAKKQVSGTAVGSYNLARRTTHLLSNCEL